MYLETTLSKHKKIIIAVIALVVLVAIFLLILFLSFGHKKKVESGSVNFSTSDSSITLTVPRSFEFKEANDDSFIMSLKSPNSLSGIYISKVEVSNIRDMSKYLEADKKTFTANFDNPYNVSDITETTIQGFQTFNYNFNYASGNYVDVYLIYKDSTFYVLDFDSHKSDLDLSSHISEIINSLKINEE